MRINVGFCGLLGLLFIGLKLGSVIDWSWWWVTCPLWIPLAIPVALLILAFPFLCVAAAFSDK